MKERFSTLFAQKLASEYIAFAVILAWTFTGGEAVRGLARSAALILMVSCWSGAVRRGSMSSALSICSLLGYMITAEVLSTEKALLVAFGVLATLFLIGRLLAGREELALLYGESEPEKGLPASH